MQKKITLCEILVILLMNYSNAQTFEIFKSDTINRIDVNGQKQGYWRFTNKIKKLPGYAEDQVVDEGNFINNKREGLWKEYYSTGKLKSEITYQENRKNGHARTYYKSGALQEEGNWLIGKWDGSYKYYYESGQLSYDWKFVNGKREGPQKYYYENGKINYDGNWKNGNENGILKEYSKEGQLIAEKKFNEGKIDEKTSKYYVAPSNSTPSSTPTHSPSNLKNNISTTPNISNPVVPADIKRDDASVGVFKESGHHKLMNPKGQVAREGIFDKGNLVEGKIYHYGPDGKLKKTLIYKGGNLVQTVEEK